MKLSVQQMYDLLNRLPAPSDVNGDCLTVLLYEDVDTSVKKSGAFKKKLVKPITRVLFVKQERSNGRHTWLEWMLEVPTQ